MKNKRNLYFSVALAGVLSLSACSTINEITGSSESVEYKSVVSGDPLSIPPDLTQANQNTKYVAPEGVARLSDYVDGQRKQSINPADRVLPQSEDIQVMRDGTMRWLVVNRPAEIIYPELLEFWNEQGFTIHNQNPRVGIIETDWAENRAKIPEGWIRSLLGSVIDQVFDSGERDRFTTRLERVNGKTEIYVSHQHMEETPTADGTGFKWLFGKEDPGVNAAMLARMMVFLGVDQRSVEQQVKQADDAGFNKIVPNVDDGQASLTLNQPFDRAWRHVGVAIDSARFTVEDRNRSNGDYYIRYLDTDTGEKIEQPNILSRVFGGRNTAEPLTLRVHLQGVANGTEVIVLDENGQRLTDATAKRVISVLAKNLDETR